MNLTAMLKKRKLNKTSHEDSPESWTEEVQAVSVGLITAGKYQPRRDFQEDMLAELAESIKIHGLLQPIMVRRAAVGYELIVGERRLRACKSLGWEVIPAIVRDIEDKEAAEIALIENLQREDLHVFEIAEGYERLLKEFDVTQEELARNLGISQANVANKIRLLKLPPEVRQIISREMLSERHARALLKLDELEQQLFALERIVKEGLSVKKTEELVKSLLEESAQPKAIERKRRAKPRFVIKDLRLFSNSIHQLTNTLKSSGLDVKVDEREDDDVYELVVTVQKRHGGEVNG